MGEIGELGQTGGVIGEFVEERGETVMVGVEGLVFFLQASSDTFSFLYELLIEHDGAIGADGVLGVLFEKSFLLTPHFLIQPGNHSLTGTW